MLLKNWFNYQYLLQNLKKSKSLLALLVGLLPLINTLILLSYASSVKLSVAKLSDISWLNYGGVYIYPVVLAIALLGYTFKKKQADFIGSMPINRKTIFCTNIIGGIIILTGIMALNVIIIAIVSLFYPNFIVAPALLWDYFVFWTISYIFVFVVAALATTVASNMVTAIVLTALILFLVPFVHDYIYKVAAFSNNYNIGYDYITAHKENFYTVPYSIIATTLNSKLTDYNLIAIIKMMVFSIIYFGIGLYLFIRKRLEINETSFKSFHLHTAVKCLTMIPLGFLFYEACVNKIGLLGSLLFIALIMAYYFIYDLITRKQISNVLVSLIYFFGLLLFTLFLGARVDSYQNYVYNKSVKMITENIKSINIRINEYYYSEEDRLEQIYTTDSQVISYFIELYKNRENVTREDQHFIDFKIIDDKKNKFNVKLISNTTDYNKIINAYLNSAELKKEYDKISDRKIVLAKIDDKKIAKKEFVNVLNGVIKKADSNQLRSLFGNEFLGIPAVNLYIYDNHKVASYTINPSADIELMNYFYNKHHTELKEYIKKNKTNNLFVRIVSKISELNFDVGYIYSSDNEIKEFINDHINDQVDFNESYFIISLDDSHNTYYFYSNAIEEFSKIYHGSSKNIDFVDKVNNYDY